MGVARYNGALLTAAQSGVGKKVGTGPLVGVATMMELSSLLHSQG